MSKFAGMSATVKSTDESIAKGMPCVIESYDPKVKKYKVDFGKGWCGWYKRSQLIIGDSPVRAD